MSATVRSVDTLVVGAGIAGLLAARAIAPSRGVVVLDKGRGVGGRLATRRIGDAVFDHGAQFLTVRDPAFGAALAPLLAGGAVERWFDRIEHGEAVRSDDPAGAHVRFRGAPTMTAVAKSLAVGLDVRTSTKVAAVAPDDDGWRVEVDGDATWRASTVVLTCPVPQSLALLDAGGAVLGSGDRDALEAIDYDPCLAVLAPLVGPSGLDGPGARRPEHPAVDWIADNHRKGTSPVPAVTIHASADWSRSHWDDGDGAIVGALLGHAALAAVPVDGASQVVRWRYATPSAPHPTRILRASGPRRLLFAGDAFGGPRVEGAALSGLAAAEDVLGG